MEKRRLFLVSLYLGIISAETKIKLQQALKDVLNCCKQENAFTCQARLSNSFQYKDRLPKDLMLDPVYKL